MLARAARSALVLDVRSTPDPAPGQVLVKVSACGVCRTDLHLVDGELPACRFPITPGHEVVGTVVAGGSGFAAGERVGIPWLGWTCGECEYCASGRENLCERARFTGCHLDGGYAEYVVADERFCLPIPERYGDAEAAPLLCAGLIGIRSYLKCGDAKNLGLYGSGAAAHILAQIARAEGRKVFAFTRPGDESAKRFSLECGQPGREIPPRRPRSRSTPRSSLPLCDIPSFPYDILWGERRIESVANLTRADGKRFMELAGRVTLRTTVKPYPLEKANEALSDLRNGTLEGAAVLLP